MNKERIKRGEKRPKNEERKKERKDRKVLCLPFCVLIHSFCLNKSK